MRADPKGAATAAGPGGSAAPLLAAAASKQLKRPILYIAAHLEEADRAADDLQTFADREVSILTAFEGRPGEGASAIEIAAERRGFVPGCWPTTRRTRSWWRPSRR